MKLEKNRQIVSMDIIIVNHDSTDCAINSIKSIYKMLDNLTINLIVTDNASHDGPQRIKQYFPEVKLILNKNNLGFSKAINNALLISHAPYVVILNPDTSISNSFFRDVLQFLKNNKTVGIIGPRVLDKNGKVQGSARKFPTPWTSIFGRKSPLTRIYPDNPFTKKEFICFDCSLNEPITVDWVSGACMIANRNAIEEVGGFDERFFLYWEDTDICKRIKENGWQVIYFPKAIVVHSIGHSTSQKPLFAIWHFHRSCYYLFKKHSMWPIKLLTPIAFWGLSLRAIFVIYLHYFAKIYRNRINNSINAQNNIEKSHDTNKIIILKLIVKKNNFVMLNLSERLNGEIVYIELGYKKNRRKISDNIIYCKKILKNITRYKPDIIHTENIKPGILGRMVVIAYNAIKNRKIKIVHVVDIMLLCDEYSCKRYYFYKIIEKILGKKTDRLLAASQTRRWELTQKHRIVEPIKVKIINPGINFNNFRNKKQQRKEIREKYKIDTKTILIGGVGSLTHRKNHLLLLNTAKELNKHINQSFIKFIIFGEGNLKNNLEKYSKKNGLSQHFIFYGWEEDVAKIYAGIDIFAHTSIYEEMPLAIIEAMAAMVPVITTGVGGVKELLGKFKEMDTKTNGFRLCERGILCPKNDPVVFANGIEYMVRNGYRGDSDRLTKAREYVLENYNSRKMNQDIVMLYEDLLKN